MAEARARLAELTNGSVSVDPPADATATARVPAALLRVGQFGEGTPALVPGPGVGHVQIIAPPPLRERAIATVATVLLRSLANAIPGAVRFRIYDPTGLGATLRAFNAFDRETVGHGNPMSTRADLDTALGALAAHATDISANHLRGATADLRTHLAEDPHSDLAHEILVLLDLPRGIDAHAAEQLSLLAAQAASRGIMLIVHQASAIDSLELGQSAARLEITAPTTARLLGVTAAPIALDRPPTDEAVERIAARPVPKRSPLLFEALHDGARHAQTSATELATPIGRAGRRPVGVSFGDDPVNALVAGIAGSGKSMLLRSMVYGLARRYDATELQLYLLDFKEGVEFQEFAPTAADPSFLPHAAVVSINSSREFGIEVLRHLSRLARERYALFGESGAAPKLEALRAKHPELQLPRVLLVIDEFHRLFDRDDALAAHATSELLNLSKQGRAAGVHFVLATQSIGDVGAGTAVGSRMEGIYKNANLRIGLRLSEAESRQIFSSTSNTAAADIHEQGVAIVNSSGGHDSFNVRTRVALIDDTVAATERRSAVSHTRAGRIPPRTFNGSIGANAGANHELRAVLRGRAAGSGWPTWPAQRLSVDHDDPRSALAMRCSFTQERRRNLAAVGAGLRAAVSLTQWTVAGLAASRPDARVLLIDLLTRDDESEHRVPRGAVDATAAMLGRAGVHPDVVRERGAAELLRRYETLLAEHDDLPCVVAIFGYTDRLTGLTNPAEPDGFDTVADRLAPLLAEAPNHHVHTIASCTSRDDLEQLDPRGATFGLRAYLDLPETVLQQLTGSDVVSPSGPLALWHDATRGSAVEALHVYEPVAAGALPDWWPQP